MGTLDAQVDEMADNKIARRVPGRSITGLPLFFLSGGADA